MKKLNPLNPLRMPNIIHILTLFLLTISLTQNAIGDTSKLVGHWIGDGININLKANHTYTYKMLKIINVDGKWSANRNALTLNYLSFGKQKKKVATYHFKGKSLILRMKGKKAVTLKKK